MYITFYVLCSFAVEEEEDDDDDDSDDDHDEASQCRTNLNF